MVVQEINFKFNELCVNFHCYKYINNIKTRNMNIKSLVVSNIKKVNEELNTIIDEYGIHVHNRIVNDLTNKELLMIDMNMDIVSISMALYCLTNDHRTALMN